MHRAARLLSILLHPLLMPTLTLWLAFQLDPQLGFFLTESSRWIVLGMVALMTIAFPLTSALLLIRTGVVSSLEMPSRRERFAPYLMTILYFAMTLYLLRRTPLHPMINGMFFGALVALVLTTAVTLWWKISAHMVGIGGTIGALLGLGALNGLVLFTPIAILLLLAGALATARLLSSDHSPAQVYTGAALGAISTYCCVVYSGVA